MGPEGGWRDCHLMDDNPGEAEAGHGVAALPAEAGGAKKARRGGRALGKLRVCRYRFGVPGLRRFGRWAWGRRC
jgi:hypothetical protein